MGARASASLQHCSPAFEVAAHKVRHPHPRPADRLKPDIVEGDTVLEATPTIVETSLPFAEVVGDCSQVPQRQGGPPRIGAGFETRNGTFAGLERVMQATRYH